MRGIRNIKSIWSSKSRLRKIKRNKIGRGNRRMKMPFTKQSTSSHNNNLNRNLSSRSRKWLQ